MQGMSQGNSEMFAQFQSRFQADGNAVMQPRIWMGNEVVQAGLGSTIAQEPGQEQVYNLTASTTYAMSLQAGLSRASDGSVLKESSNKAIRLTPMQRVAIVQMDSVDDPKQRLTQAEIANIFGISRSAITKILRPESVEKIRKKYESLFTSNMAVHQSDFSRDLAFCSSEEEIDHKDVLPFLRGMQGGFVEFNISRMDNETSRIIPLWISSEKFGLAAHGYQNLVSAVCSEFRIDLHLWNTIRLYYIDDDGDFILVSSDHELWVAIQHFPESGHVRLFVRQLPQTVDYH
eukprot:767658-Hanusia_phi.AAC.2